MNRTSMMTIHWIVPVLLLFSTFLSWSNLTAQDPDSYGSFQAASLVEANSIVKKPAPFVPVDSKTGDPGMFTPEGGGGLCMWGLGTAFPIPILDQATVTHGGFLYTFGGVSNGAVIDNVFRFDGTTWTPLAPLPLGVEFPSAVSDGTFIYVLGGAEGTLGVAQTTLYRYDPTTDTYLTMASFSTGTWNQSAVYLSGKIYKFCGSTDAGSTNVLEIYDVASNTWSAGAPYPLASSFVGAFVNAGRVYGAGGIDAASGIENAKTYCYNPALNSWDDAAIADLPGNRWGAASSGTVFGPGTGSWVLAAGYENGTIGSTTIRWDPAGNSWSALANMPGDRARMTGAQYNGAFYVIGGRSAASPGFGGEASNHRLICLENMAFITSGAVSIVSEDCAPANGAPDPGETLTVALPLMNAGDIPTVALTATLQATGGVTNPSGPVNYGAVAPDNLPVSRNFTFTVDPNAACGDSITLTWIITDGAENYPNATKTYSTGVRVETLADNMDGATAPNLPAGWSNVQTNGNGISWVTTVTTPFSAPNAAFANDPPSVNAAALTSPAVLIESADSQLSFKNFYNTETGFDGGVLEYSTNGGATWTDVIGGGGTFASGGYNTTISSSFQSPISGRMAWAGNSGGYLDTVVNLPPALNGQTAIFRWLMATDNSVASTGWWVDDVRVLGARECSECGGVQTVFPDSVTTTRGLYVSGDVNSLATSDNQDYVIRRGIADIQSRTEFVVDGSTTIANPTSLVVTLEGAVFARSTVVQTIELFNFDSMAYELIDTRNSTNMVDSTAVVNVAGPNLGRFVDDATMGVRARVHFQSANPRQRFSSNTDQIKWELGQ